MKSWTFYASELESEICQCNKLKGKGKAFCPNCYYKLPINLRDGLFKRFGKNYIEEYEKAHDFLNQ